MPDPKKPKIDVDEDAFDPNDPGASKAGRGGIVSPGGTQPKPKEDPRQDSGLPYPDQSPPTAQPEPPHPEQQ